MQDQETEFRNVKSWYPNMFPQGTVVSSGQYDATLYVVESVREDRHAQFCLNVRELIDGELPSSSVEELYPAWVDKIVIRGDGPLARKKLFTPWHFPRGTVFEVHNNVYSGPLYDAVQTVEITTYEASEVITDDEGYYYVIGEVIHSDGTVGHLDRVCVNHVDKIVKRGQGNVRVSGRATGYGLLMNQVNCTKASINSYTGFSAAITQPSVARTMRDIAPVHAVNVQWINKTIEAQSWAKRLPDWSLLVKRKQLKRWIAQNIRRMLRKD